MNIVNASLNSSSLDNNHSERQPYDSGSMMAQIFATGYVPVSNHVLDKIMAELSASEYKVYMYIYRRTVGFQKESDSITLSQFVNGIVTKDGKILDNGTGLSKATVVRCLNSLEQKGHVLRYRGQSDKNENQVSIYQINLPFDNPQYHVPIQAVISETDEAFLNIDDNILQEEIEQVVITQSSCNLPLEDIPEPLSISDHTQPDHSDIKIRQIWYNNSDRLETFVYKNEKGS